MPYTFDQLKHMTVAELRDIAAGLKPEPIQGHTQMNKEHLLASLCKAFNIDMHTHHHVAAAAAGAGHPSIEKSGIKQEIRHLKEERTAALKAHDSGQLHDLRHKIHELKRSLRKAADE